MSAGEQFESLSMEILLDLVVTVFSPDIHDSKKREDEQLGYGACFYITENRNFFLARDTCSDQPMRV